MRRWAPRKMVGEKFIGREEKLKTIDQNTKIEKANLIKKSKRLKSCRKKSRRGSICFTLGTMPIFINSAVRKYFHFLQIFSFFHRKGQAPGTSNLHESMAGASIQSQTRHKVYILKRIRVEIKAALEICKTGVLHPEQHEGALWISHTVY